MDENELIQPTIPTLEENESGSARKTTISVGPAMDRLFRRLSREWNMSYSDVANVMFERGTIIEAAFEEGFPVSIKTPTKEILLNDDRPIRRPLVSGEDAEKLKLLG